MGKTKAKAKAPARNERTSKSVATKASKLLSNPKKPKNIKSVAASALTQAPNKSKTASKSSKSRVKTKK